MAFRLPRFLSIHAFPAFCACLLSLQFATEASHGATTFTQVQIGSTATGASIGINAANTYTHLVTFNPSPVANVSVNGVIFNSYIANPTTTDPFYFTATRSNGLTNDPVAFHLGTGHTPAGTTELQNLLKPFAYQSLGTGITGTLSLTLNGLTAGHTYTTRIYGYGWGAALNSRVADFTTSADGTASTQRIDWQQYGLDSSFYVDVTYTLASGTSATIHMAALGQNQGIHISAFSNQLMAVPEPSRAMLLMAAGMCLGLVRRRVAC